MLRLKQGEPNWVCRQYAPRAISTRKWKRSSRRVFLSVMWCHWSSPWFNWVAWIFRQTRYYSILALHLQKALPFSMEEVPQPYAQCTTCSAVKHQFHEPHRKSRTVRSCSPWGGQWIELWRTIWSMLCSSAPHSQANEGAIPQLCKQEAVRPDPRCS